MESGIWDDRIGCVYVAGFFSCAGGTQHTNNKEGSIRLAGNFDHLRVILAIRK